MDKYKLFINKQETNLHSRRLISNTTEYYYELIKEESKHNDSRQLIISQYIMKGIVNEYVRNKKYDLINMKRHDGLGNFKYDPDPDKEVIDIVEAFLNLEDDYIEINSITLKKFEEIIEINGNGIISTNVPLDSSLLKLIYNIYSSR